MLKCKVSLLLLAACMAGLTQTATDLDALAVQRVAKKIMCSCGCKLDMTCLMPPGLCSVCQRGKAKIYAMQAQGKPDSAILAEFAKAGGLESLVVTPGVMGVAGPCAAILLGLGIVLWKIAQYTRSNKRSDLELDAAMKNVSHEIEQYLANGD
jgi:hypothetical protein